MILLAFLFVGSFMLAHDEMSTCGHHRADLFARESCRGEAIASDEYLQRQRAGEALRAKP
jgi:hypothetical protein